MPFESRLASTTYLNLHYLGLLCLALGNEMLFHDAQDIRAYRLKLRLDFRLILGDQCELVRLHDATRNGADVNTRERKRKDT